VQVIVQAIASSSFPLGAKNYPEEAFSQGFALETQRKHTANNIEKQNLKHPPISKTHNDLKEELPKYYAHECSGCADSFNDEAKGY